ncbi:MAG: outer membrane lipoprotein carrier protein LolA [Desulfuromonas sp.]|nr:outer membrane lipoprotein carrier protein LolA [Desulfuromonas sp.]
MRTLLTLVLSVLLPLTASAMPMAASAILKPLQQRFADINHPAAIHDFNAEFYQKAHIASLGRTRTGRGTISMRFEQASTSEPKTLLRWIYKVPSNQQIISDGQTLWVYLPDNNQVMISPVEDSLEQGNDPMLFLRNLGRLEQYFDVCWANPAQNDQQDYRLLLTPKKTSTYIKNLTLTVPHWISDKTPPAGLPLRRAAILDPSGNNTELEFRNVTLNQQPPLAQFHFELPEKVEIVRPSDLKLNFK